MPVTAVKSELETAGVSPHARLFRAKAEAAGLAPDETVDAFVQWQAKAEKDLRARFTERAKASGLPDAHIEPAYLEWMTGEAQATPVTPSLLGELKDFFSNTYAQSGELVRLGLRGAMWEVGQVTQGLMATRDAVESPKDRGRAMGVAGRAIGDTLGPGIGAALGGLGEVAGRTAATVIDATLGGAATKLGAGIDAVAGAAGMPEGDGASQARSAADELVRAAYTDTSPFGGKEYSSASGSLGVGKMVGEAAPSTVPSLALMATPVGGIALLSAFALVGIGSADEDLRDWERLRSESAAALGLPPPSGTGTGREVGTVLGYAAAETVPEILSGALGRTLLRLAPKPVRERIASAVGHSAAKASTKASASLVARAVGAPLAVMLGEAAEEVATEAVEAAIAAPQNLKPLSEDVSDLGWNSLQAAAGGAFGGGIAVGGHLMVKRGMARIADNAAMLEGGELALEVREKGRQAQDEAAAERERIGLPVVRGRGAMSANAAAITAGDSPLGVFAVPLEDWMQDMDGELEASMRRDGLMVGYDGRRGVVAVWNPSKVGTAARAADLIDRLDGGDTLAWGMPGMGVRDGKSPTEALVFQDGVGNVLGWMPHGDAAGARAAAGEFNKGRGWQVADVIPTRGQQADAVRQRIDSQARNARAKVSADAKRQAGRLAYMRSGPLHDPAVATQLVERQVASMRDRGVDAQASIVADDGLTDVERGVAARASAMGLRAVFIDGSAAGPDGRRRSLPADGFADAALLPSTVFLVREADGSLGEQAALSVLAHEMVHLLTRRNPELAASIASLQPARLLPALARYLRALGGAGVVDDRAWRDSWLAGLQSGEILRAARAAFRAMPQTRDESLAQATSETVGGDGAWSALRGATNRLAGVPLLRYSRLRDFASTTLARFGLAGTGARASVETWLRASHGMALEEIRLSQGLAAAAASRLKAAEDARQARGDKGAKGGSEPSKPPTATTTPPDDEQDDTEDEGLAEKLDQAFGDARDGDTEADTEADKIPQASATIELAAVGAETEIVAGNERVKAQYALVDIAQLRPSHDPTKRGPAGGFVQVEGGAPNERPYHDENHGADSIEVVRRIATSPDVRMLVSDTPTAVDGPPIVDPSNGWVLGGNARTMGMQLVYSAGGEPAEALRRAMREAAGRFGMPDSGGADVANPVVVRVLRQQIDPERASKLLNEAPSAGKSEATLAAASAANLSDGTLQLVAKLLAPAAGEERTLREVMSGPDDAIAIVRRLQADGAWGPAEVARYWDRSQERLTDAGKLAIERMLMLRAMGDESLAGEIAGPIADKLLAAMPHLLRAARSEGHAAALQQLVPIAVAELLDWQKLPKETRSPIGEHLFDQGSLGTPSRGSQDAVVASLMQGLHTLGPRKFAAAVGAMIDDASGGEGMLGEGLAPATPLQAAALDHLGKGLVGPGIDRMRERLGEIATPVDTLDVLDARRESDRLLRELGPTSTIDTEERRALRLGIADEYVRLSREDDETKIAPGHGGGLPLTPLRTERKAWVVIGPPAAGKSTLCAQLCDANGAMLLDSDVVKRKLPEWGPLAPPRVHQESSQVLVGIMRGVEKAGSNLVYAGLGRVAATTEEMVRRLQAKGYTVSVIAIDADRSVVARRLVDRWRKSGRFVDPAIGWQLGRQSLATYAASKAVANAHGLVKSEHGRFQRVEDADGFGHLQPGRGGDGARAGAAGRGARADARQHGAGRDDQEAGDRDAGGRGSPADGARRAADVPAPAGGVDAGVGSDAGAGDAASLSIRQSRVFETSVTSMVDRFFALRLAEEDLEKLRGTPLTDDESAYLGARLLNGKLMTIQERAGARYLPILARQQKAGITVDEMDEFLYAQHAEERNRQIASINATMPDGGSGMTTADAAAIIAGVAADPRSADFESIADDWRELLREAFRAKVDAGLIQPRVARQMLATYQRYVPLRGRDQDFSDETLTDTRGTGLSQTSRDNPRALGRDSRALAITGQISRQYENSMQMVARNEVAQRFLRFALDLNDPDMLELITPTRQAIVDGQVKPIFDFAWSRQADQFGVYVSEPMAIGTKKYRKGDLVVIKIHDPRLAQALTGTMERLDNRLLQALDVVTNVWRGLTTTYNPAFLVTNLPRDLGASLANITSLHGVRTTARWMRNLAPTLAATLAWNANKSIAGNQHADGDRWIELWRDHGGQMGFWEDRTLEKRNDRLLATFARLAKSESGIRRGGRLMRQASLGVLEGLNAALEQTSRVALFRTLVEQGMSPERAALAARDVTVDFGRKGRQLGFLNRWWVFLNAGTQGTWNQVAAMATLRGSLVTAATVGLGYMTAAISRHLGGDDPETGLSRWELVPEYRKAAFLNILTGDGTYYSAPLPYGWSGLFYAGVQLEALVSGQKTASQAATDSFIGALESWSPIGGSGIKQSFLATIVPTVVRPYAELGLNENFAGKPIVPEPVASDATPQPDSWTTWPSTSDWSKRVAQGLNAATGGDRFTSGVVDVHPETVQYLVGFYLSGVGRLASQTATVASGDYEAGDIPLIRTFRGEAGPRSLIQEKFRAGVRAALTADEAVRTYESEGDYESAGRYERDRPGDIDAAPAMRSAEREIARLRKLIRSAETTEERRELQAEVLSVMKQALRDRNESLRAAGQVGR